MELVLALSRSPTTATTKLRFLLYLNVYPSTHNVVAESTGPTREKGRKRDKRANERREEYEGREVLTVSLVLLVSIVRPLVLELSQRRRD